MKMDIARCDNTNLSQFEAQSCSESVLSHAGPSLSHCGNMHHYLRTKLNLLYWEHQVMPPWAMLLN